MSHLTDVIEEEVDELFDTEYMTGKQPNLTKERAKQAMTKSALAVIEAIRTTFKDQSEIGVNHLNVELDYQLEKLVKSK